MIIRIIIIYYMWSQNETRYSKQNSIFYSKTEMISDTRIPLQFMYFILLTSISLHFETIKLVHSSSNISCFSDEREALIIFKKGLSDPSNRLSSWLGKNCCNWDGITCDTKTRHVIALDLQNPSPYDLDASIYAIGGEISQSLIKLKSLRYLDLSMNNFEGIKIPPFIGLFEDLRYLNLSGANFDGNIPTQVGNLSKLVSLDLNSGFSYESGAKDLNFLPRLSSLQYLNLGNVNLSLATNNWLEMIKQLQALRELHLPSCGLSNLPLSLSPMNFTSLSYLDLSNNGFNSSIPKWLFNLTSLVFLDMNSNTLYGNIPEEFSNLVSIQHIDLSSNFYIQGGLPKNLGNLCQLRNLWLASNNITGEIVEFFDGLSKCSNSSFEYLDLGYNDMFGFIPNSLGLIKSLKNIYLSVNSFTGSLPKSIGNLTTLQEFYLFQNKMNGTIPESLGQLYSLSVLDISKNNWHGVVTESHLFNLTSLTELSISTSLTTLSFNVSTKWVPPFKLNFLSLFFCQLGPKFPFWLRNQDELNSIFLHGTMISDSVPDWFCELDLNINELDFSYNELSGRVPDSFNFQDATLVDLGFNRFTGSLPNFTANIETLYLRNNLFYGSIPDDINKMLPNLTDYDVSQNFLTGTIPVSLGDIPSLTSLLVSSNNLTGEIPLIWDDKPLMYLVDLSNNRFFGKIPSSMGSLSALRFLRLGNNNLSGEIPSSLQNCVLMDSFDLGENHFSGKIPSWVGEKMSLLRIVRLRKNSLSGYVPSKLCTLANLHILDLAQNKLSGEIPSCLGLLKGMSIDLIAEIYEGQLSVVTKGTELEYQHTLYLVNSIDLSGNNLSGKIPKELSDLSRLGTLNLSMNHLTGKIPEEIGKLKRLETLDLSINKFFGSIPSTMGSMFALSHLNLSYNNFSGRIPTSNQFLTLDDPSIYKKNAGLCGFPLTTKCPGDDKTSRSPSGKGEERDDEDESEGDNLWFYVSIVIGIIVGFWGFCSALFIKQSWRNFYFAHVENMIEKVLAPFRVDVDHTRRRR